jgi:murein DD-endopeptidase MepM/ murein hydrolase activator NlpD
VYNCAHMPSLVPSSPRPSSVPPLALALALGLVASSAQASPSLSVQPGTAKPGDPVLVTVSGLEGQPTGTLSGRPLRFYEAGGVWQAISGLPVEHALGVAEVKVAGPTVELRGTVEVVDPGYPNRELQVAGKYVKPPASVKKRIAEDKAAFAKAFSQPFSAPLFQKDFEWPRLDRITAPYGDRRSFNGKLKSQHFGMDIDGDTGDPIHASNDGVVVMSRDCYSSGGTVILHHGGGLYTSYFHMSAIDVKEGTKVKQGQLLGQVGSTGRVTGPHLHWGVKADGLWVDGGTLLKLDFGISEPRVATTETPSPLPSGEGQGEGAASVSATP